MTHQEYQRKVALLRGYEALLKNPAYAELRGRMRQEFENCIAGLRNRKISAAERQEYQEGADVAERLLSYAEDRLAALKKETQLTQSQLDALGDDLSGDDGDDARTGAG